MSSQEHIATTEFKEKLQRYGLIEENIRGTLPIFSKIKSLKDIWERYIKKLEKGRK